MDLSLWCWLLVLTATAGQVGLANQSGTGLGANTTIPVPPNNIQANVVKIAANHLNLTATLTPTTVRIGEIVQLTINVQAEPSVPEVAAPVLKNDHRLPDALKLLRQETSPATKGQPLRWIYTLQATETLEGFPRLRFSFYQTRGVGSANFAPVSTAAIPEFRILPADTLQPDFLPELQTSSTTAPSATSASVSASTAPQAQPLPSATTQAVPWTPQTAATPASTPALPSNLTRWWIWWRPQAALGLVVAALLLAWVRLRRWPNRPTPVASDIVQFDAQPPAKETLIDPMAELLQQLADLCQLPPGQRTGVEIWAALVASEQDPACQQRWQELLALWDRQRFDSARLTEAEAALQQEHLIWAQAQLEQRRQHNRQSSR